MKQTESPKQFPDTARMRVKILHLRKMQKSWTQICVELVILKADGRPDHGTAYHIADGLELGEEVRRRLGLKPMCGKCRRPVPRPKVKRDPPRLPDELVWWNKQTKADRDYMIFKIWDDLGRPA